MKTHEDIQKKKNSKFKEAMEEKKVKKKVKKKKKKKRKTSALSLDSSFLLTQGGEAPERHKLKADRKKKKRVAFDLSPGYPSAKCPKLVCSSEQLHSGRPGHSQGQNQDQSQDQDQGQSHASESQCPSEDLNSQDLFITQKTFRVSSSESSSGEVLPPSPPLFMPRDKLHTSLMRMKAHPQRPRETIKHVEKTKTGQGCLTEDKAAESRPAQTASLDKPADVKRHSCTAGQLSVWCPPVSTGSTSTQTDNFFTSQLSTFLSFCQKRQVSVHLEDLRPLDLSLPQRARKELETLKSGGTGGDDPHPSGCLPRRDMEVKTDSRGKTEATLSSQSGSEPKTTDTTTSSEDEPPCRPGRLDLIQVKAVQTRLNESFFFKTKGKGQSPRPESPLMKLAQGREGKSRKSHRV